MVFLLLWLLELLLKKFLRPNLLDITSIYNHNAAALLISYAL